MTPAELALARHAAIRRRLDPSDPEARLVWDYLAEMCHVTVTTHVAGDPHASAMNEGKRVVFLALAGLAQLPLTPS